MGICISVKCCPDPQPQPDSVVVVDNPPPQMYPPPAYSYPQPPDSVMVADNNFQPGYQGWPPRQ